MIKSFNEECDDENDGKYFLDQGDFVNVDEVRADAVISRTENIQYKDSRSLVGIDFDYIFIEVANVDIQNAPLVQT